ncbi:MAG: hypothetical protein UV59_C0011G0032 [Candidatus Gottesmanbacteria bacterium GW2011_GWA1_43_11]|uniref:Uncharacterized protein n=1 Tax=Candidatus Gottesmanbacteria bacterium GW2011_GWA1_43_11 TaxID=1618436 RepID=A0A0G1EPW3_9BACT|nr:MAG: hypothetical protein UV59_C0011G0032 [Candidatus Gottesmanbacteria bacterium GW2011_GWA1_43_11]
MAKAKKVHHKVRHHLPTLHQPVPHVVAYVLLAILFVIVVKLVSVTTGVGY